MANIYEKLANVYENVGYLQKKNKGNQYSYVGSSDVLASVREKMVEQKLLLEPRITDTNVQILETKKGTQQIFTELDMTYTWVNVEKPEEKIELPFYAQGMDLAGEKGVGKALTYAEKYFLLKYFNIATDNDDPDKFQDKVETQKKQQPKKQTKYQRDELDKKITEYMDLKNVEGGQAKEKLINWVMDKAGLKDKSLETITHGELETVIGKAKQLIDISKEE